MPLNIHSDFRLNGRPHDAASLLDLAQVLHKMGDEEEKQLATFLLDWLFPKDELLVQTSGSTGAPKTIALSKEKMVQSARATGEFFHLPARTTALHCLPIKFIAGKMMLVRALSLGWHLDVVVPNKSPLSQTKKEYDFAALVPYQLHHSLDKLERVKKVIVGGGAVSQSLQDKLQSLVTEVFATYGMTETITHVAVKRLNHHNGSAVFYEALPGINFSVDGRGCLLIDVPRLADKKIVTNDVVALQSNNCFEWLGRHDSIINSGGIKVNPETLERKLEAHIDRPFFISSLPDDQLTQKIVLVIEGDAYKLPKAAFAGWDTYEMPKETYFLPKFAYTPTGKIRRKESLKNFEG